MDAKRRKTHAKLTAMPGVRRVRRPITSHDDSHFDLHYVRTGPKTDRPIVIIPGGPGLASVLPYRSLRATATAEGLDVIMIEHRGVGLSRHDDTGSDLPMSALTIEQVVTDIAAVLNDVEVDTAILYGASYGTYLVQGFGARHPGRVAAMVLDSPLLTAKDDTVVRSHMRRLLWDGAEPPTAEAARKLRTLVGDGVVTPESTGMVVPVLYEFGGVPLLERQLDLLTRGKGMRTWNWVAGLGSAETERSYPFYSEFDLVGVIAFRELKYRPDPDGLPLDPNLGFLAAAAQFPAFEAEPYDLPAALPHFSWPTVVISGDQDLRTPRPVAERIVDLVPRAVLMPLEQHGHSALDTHQQAAVRIARDVVHGTYQGLPERTAAIRALPRRGASSLIATIIRTRLALERFAPRRK